MLGFDMHINMDNEHAGRLLLQMAFDLDTAIITV
jgi:hypothetical protein